MNKLGIYIMLVLVVGSGLAMAIAPADSWTVVARARYTGVNGDANVTTEGGNVTNLNFNSVNVSTAKWAGYWGNLTSAKLVLAASRNFFYTWAWNATNGGVVCAVAAPSGFAWGSAVAAAASDVDTMWSFTGADSDSAVNTLKNATCALNIGGKSITSAVSALTGVGGFTTCAIADGATAAKSDFAFCANLSSAGNLFNGQTGNYEVMAPTNKTIGTTETHYFWLELY